MLRHFYQDQITIIGTKRFKQALVAAYDMLPEIAMFAVVIGSHSNQVAEQIVQEPADDDENGVVASFGQNVMEADFEPAPHRIFAVLLQPNAFLNISLKLLELGLGDAAHDIFRQLHLEASPQIIDMLKVDRLKMHESAQLFEYAIKRYRLDLRSAVRSRLHFDETLNFQCFQGFPDRSFGAAVMLHQQLFIGETIAGAQILPGDPLMKIRQDLVRKLHLPELTIADWSAQLGL
jgi:hypothetical protein